eukprot:SM000036S13230  [mRNA]  locus=s36:22852:24471:+ [translate_table: standard]
MGLQPGLAVRYVADAAHFPYGGKPPAAVAARAMALGRDLGRHWRPQLVAVLATEQTVSGGRLAALCRLHAHGTRVELVPMPGLADFVEAGEVTGDRVAALIGSALGPLIRDGCDTIVLGCTHYSFLKACLSEVLPAHVEVVDAAPAVARRVLWVLARDGYSPNCTSPQHRRPCLNVSTTGDPHQLVRVVQQLHSATGMLPLHMHVQQHVHSVQSRTPSILLVASSV